MKKLMIAASAALCATVGFSLESANVVGYQNVDALDSQTGNFANFYAGGPCFSAVGASGASYKLGDVKMNCGAAGEDVIQFLTDDSATTYMIATYVSKDEDAELEGWWDVTEDDIGVTSLNEETFDAGKSFLCAFTSGGEVSFTYAGEVVSGAKEITIPTGTGFPFVGNPLPAQFTLGQVALAGSAAGEDLFQFLDDTATTYKIVTYVTEDEDAELCGWWDVTEADIGEESANDITLAPGQGMLGAFTSGGEVVIKFPAVLNN
jgi:hypothetical protein